MAEHTTATRQAHIDQIKPKLYFSTLSGDQSAEDADRSFSEIYRVLDSYQCILRSSICYCAATGCSLRHGPLLPCRCHEQDPTFPVQSLAMGAAATTTTTPPAAAAAAGACAQQWLTSPREAWPLDVPGRHCGHQRQQVGFLQGLILQPMGHLHMCIASGIPGQHLPCETAHAGSDMHTQASIARVRFRRVVCIPACQHPIQCCHARHGPCACLT